MPDIYISTMGAVGQITLARPKSLNSLTANMISQIELALTTWEVDPNIAAVIINAEGEKAFCAGGDITDIYDQGKNGNFKFGQRFWANEYRLNLKIAQYPKPYIAFMQGFTMGGGVGVSCHGSHRIVGEKSIIAMPECGIGLVPDVGGSHLLARLNGHIGTFLGTTAFRMNAGDSIFCKFADHFIPVKFWPDIIKQIAVNGDVKEVLRKHQRQSPESTIKKLTPIIEDVMSPKDYKQLEKRMSNYIELLPSLESLRKNSPLSVAFTHSMLRIPKVAKNLKAALEIEYRYTFRAQEKTDFLEGIRAMVIDKDRNPSWRHESLKDVKEEEVLSLLEPITLKFGEH